MGILAAGARALGIGAAATPPRTDEGGHDKNLHRIWKAQGLMDLGRTLYGAVRANLPQFQHAISVSCVGGPAADIRRVWYLACAAAFGRFRNTVRTKAGAVNMRATWNVSDKAAQIEIVMQTNALDDAADSFLTPSTFGLGTFIVQGAIPILPGVGLLPGIGLGVAGVAAVKPPGADPKRSPIGMIHRGPEQLTVGAGWPGFLQRTNSNPPTPRAAIDWVSPVPCDKNTPGNPVEGIRVYQTRQDGPNVYREFPIGLAGQTGANAYPYAVLEAVDGTTNPAGIGVDGITTPILPDDGRVITTVEKTDPKVQSPMPQLDGNSRSNLMLLVSQVLTSSCFLPPSMPCTATNAATAGRFINAPGANLSLPALGTLIQPNIGRANVGQALGQINPGQTPPLVAPDGTITGPAPSTFNNPATNLEQ